MPAALNLSNEVVKMRAEVKRVKVLIIRKLTRQSTALKKKKGTEADLERNQRRAARLLEEVRVLKALAPDVITKTALQSDISFEKVCQNKDTSLSERATARVAAHPDFSKKIQSIKTAVEAFKAERTGAAEKKSAKQSRDVDQEESDDDLGSDDEEESEDEESECGDDLTEQISTAEEQEAPSTAKEKSSDSTPPEVSRMRKEVKKLRVLIIRKLTQQITGLKKPTAEESERTGNQECAARLQKEVQVLRGLQPDFVTRRALEGIVDLERVFQDPESSPAERAAARIATHARFVKKLQVVRSAVDEEKAKAAKAEEKNSKEEESGKVARAEGSNSKEAESGKVARAEENNSKEAESGKVARAEENNSKEAESGKVARAEENNSKEAESGTIHGVADEEDEEDDETNLNDADDGRDDAEKRKAKDPPLKRVNIVKRPVESRSAKDKPSTTKSHLGETEKALKPPGNLKSPKTLEKPEVIQKNPSKTKESAPTPKQAAKPATKKPDNTDDEDDSESDLSDSEEEEEKEYFDDSTEERFHKQSSQSEQSDDDDDFFLGKVSKFKKKRSSSNAPSKEKNDSEKPAEGEDTTESSKASQFKMQSVFCSALSKSSGPNQKGKPGGPKPPRFQNQKHSDGKPSWFKSQDSGTDKRPFRNQGPRQTGPAGDRRGQPSKPAFDRHDNKPGKQSQQALHPSWEASRKRKEQQAQITAFQGKKIKFDLDD
ncbi:serum response factor-binding protein 1 [Trichomycterus rosablanca]|uniref:serum response factor-binding protein 1 n=1 Tax=Trichomycterus rosablanca TaxID=2290929 RepID=UPI002F35A007